MSRYQSIQDELNQHSPIPVDFPKLYLLGDTGAGKTTIIRKMLGTEESKYPTTRQKRTTVAPTEYVISNEEGYDITVILRSLDEIKGYVDEILKTTIVKFYENKLETKIGKNLRQTADQQFRLYYILSDESSTLLQAEIISFIPLLNSAVEEIKSIFPNEKEENYLWVDLAISESLENQYDNIRNNVLLEIQRKTRELCDGQELGAKSVLYKYSTKSRSDFISKCKSILSSEQNSISPIVEYARVRGRLKADWLDDDMEAVLIDGEGIGHDTKETSLLDVRHYDHMYDANAILLIEESKKPFIGGGKNALKSIFSRGYGDKMFLLFTKLDEVEIYDSDEPASEEERKEDVKDGLDNVIASLHAENVDVNLDETRVLYLSDMKELEMDASSGNQITSMLKKIQQETSQKYVFVSPSYDFELLSAFLIEAAQRFDQQYSKKLDREHWKTIEAFTRRMTLKIDSFRMFTPITDLEESINQRVDSFISQPESWEYGTTESLKKRSLNRIRMQFNRLIIEFARKVIIQKPQQDWRIAYDYNGVGSTFKRKRDVKFILKRSVPSAAKEEGTQDFKNSVKALLEESISNCKNSED